MSLGSASVTAVIVSFNPDHKRVRRLLESVQPQVDNVVVVDNGSGAATTAYLRELGAGLGFELIEFERNRGIAAAHNAGIRLAMQQQQQYVLLLDHDSVLSPDCVAQLLSAYQDLFASGAAVAAVGPRYLDETSGQTAPFLRYTRCRSLKIYPRQPDDRIEASVLISSGSLIRTDTLRAVGLMDESLFVDGVDWDWCFRASAMGYRLFGIAAALMTHSLGDRAISLWRWKIPQHSPLRHYYTYRNAILLCRRQTVPMSWKLHFLARLLVRFVIYMLVSPQRAHRCRLIVRGVADGLRNRGGPA